MKIAYFSLAGLPDFKEHGDFSILKDLHALCLYVNRIAAGLSLFLFLQWELVSTVIYGIYKVQLKRSKCINFHANEQKYILGLYK